MTSQIDATVPITGTPTTASVRMNFATAGSEITALQASAAGALQTSGGTMMGPLLVTATGSPTTRAVQDHFADEINIVDWGASNTGTDCTPIMQAALATGKNVYMPGGVYRWNNQITVGNASTAQRLRGDGLSTYIIIEPNFNATASSIILLQGAEGAAPTVQDIRIGFFQPNTVGNRASFVPLGNPNATNGIAGVMYPPVILFGGTTSNNRFKLERIRIEKCWNGIFQQASGNSGGWWMRGIEISAFNIGLQVASNIDFSHITGWHAWPFAMTASHQAVYEDGAMDCMQFGIGQQSQAVNVHGVANFCGRIYVDNAGTWVQFSNLMMDSDNARLELNNCEWVQVTNCYATCSSTGPSSGQPTFKVTNGKLDVIGFHGWGGLQPLISISGGRMDAIGGLWQGTVNNVSVVQQTGGILRISNIELYVPASAAWTNPIVNSTGGVLNFTSNLIGSASAGDVGAVVIATDTANNNVTGNNWSNWRWNPPGNLGFYGLNSSGPMILHNLPTSPSGLTTGTVWNNGGVLNIV